MELIILDDAAQFAPQSGDNWQLISVNRRFRSLPEKFNALAGFARGDILFVWEDDDVYLPWHVSSHVQALFPLHAYSKPSVVQSHYQGRLQEEQASGRFHASVAFTREALVEINGWPLTLRGDFDQIFMSRLSRLGPTADPTLKAPPSYIFRWEATQDYHGQGYMTSAGDETWYDRAVQAECHGTGERLAPEFDENTRLCFQQLNVEKAIST